MTLVDDTPIASNGYIQGDEDTPIELTWATFGVSDEDSTNPKVVFTSLPAGSIEYYSNGAWVKLSATDLKTDTSAGKSFSQADFDGHNVRYTPAANESGDDSFVGTVWATSRPITPSCNSRLPTAIPTATPRSSPWISTRWRMCRL